MITEENRTAPRSEGQAEETPVQDQQDAKAHQGHEQHGQQLAHSLRAEEQSLDQQFSGEMTQALQPAPTEFQQQRAQVEPQQTNYALHPSANSADETTPEANGDASGHVQAFEAESTKLVPPSCPTPEAQPEELAPAGGQTGVSGLLHATWEVLKQGGEQSLRPLLDITLDALFSESTRKVIQRQMEQTLRPLLHSGLDIVPNTAARNGLQHQAETTLQAALQESVDAIFAVEVRTRVRTHLESAFNALLRANWDVARLELKEAIRVLVYEVLPVLQRYLERIPRLLLSVILSVLQDAAACIGQKDVPRASPQARAPAGG
jgi:hypothetical protein